MTEIDPTKETIGLTTEGLIDLCCDCPEEIEAKLWCCPGRTYRTCGLMYNATVDIVFTVDGSPLYRSFTALKSIDDGVSESDPDGTLYPKNWDNCATSVVFRITGLNVTDNPDGTSRDYDVKIELETNPEGHPGWEFTLNFPNTTNTVFQNVELTFPDSPINNLIGSSVFTFATTEKVAVENSEPLLCELPEDFLFWLSSYNIKQRSNGYWWMNTLLLCQTYGRHIPNPNPNNGPCPEIVRWEKMESEPQRKELPNPYGKEEFDVFVWEDVYWRTVNRSLWNQDNSGGYQNRKYHQFYNGGGLSPDSDPNKYCRRSRQHRINDNRHYYSYGDIIYEKYSGYDEFSDFGQLPSSAPCGHQRANNFWDDAACDGQPYAVMMNVTADGKDFDRSMLWPKGAVWGFGTWLGGHSAWVRITRPTGQQDPTYGTYVGGVNPGDRLFSNLPVESLPPSGLDNIPGSYPGSWSGRNPLQGGFGFDLEANSTDVWFIAYFNGGMGPGKEDSPDNPENIRYVSINPNEEYQFEKIPGMTCCTPGTYTVSVNVPFRITYWDNPTPLASTFEVTFQLDMIAGTPQ